MRMLATILLGVLAWGTVRAEPDPAKTLTLLEQAQLKNLQQRLDALEKLLELTEDEDFSPQQSDQAIPILFKLLKNDSLDVRLQGLRLIAKLDEGSFHSKMPEGQAVAKFVDSMLVTPEQEYDPRTTAIREQVALLLTFCGRTGIPVLVELLKQPNAPPIRRQAAESLGNLGPKAKDALVPLATALDDPDPLVHKAAEIAMHKIGL